MFNKHYKVQNLHQKNYRKRFEKQKIDPSFRRWKKNRLDNQGGRCFYCFEYIELKGSHIEHLIPLWRGGTNHRKNLVVSCPPCNRKKGIKLLSEEDILNKRQLLNKLVKDDLARIAQEDEDIGAFLRSL